MRWLFLTCILTFFSIPCLFSQNNFQLKNISEFEWELDYQIFLKLSNDSTFRSDIRELFHVPKGKIDFSSDYVYYPVNLDEDYVKNVTQHMDTTNENLDGYKTLWGALHASLGGGWVHFTNCLLYAFETGQLSLTAPLMKRPQTKWKPNPVTETYKRTRKWEYYTPVDQKRAIMEFKVRRKNDELGDISSIPGEYVSLLLKTNNKEYMKYQEAGDVNTLAKIDLVKLMLGVNFLGEAQISYIRSKVLKTVKNYSLNKLPSILIFDEFDAAAIMTLDTDGYKVDNIAFKKSGMFTKEEMEQKRNEIFAIIHKINDYNNNSFKKRLGNYYQK